MSAPLDQSTYVSISAAAERLLRQWRIPPQETEELAHDAAVLVLLRYSERSLIDQRAIARTIARRQAFRAGIVRDRIRRAHDAWLESCPPFTSSPAVEDAMVAEGLADYAAAVSIIVASGKTYAAAVDPAVAAALPSWSRRKAVYRGMQALRRIMEPHTTTFDDDAT